MRALVWHGKEDIRCDTVSDPEIQEPRDAIVKVSSCAICGSDLHLFHNFIPAMLPGDIMGHEMMGEVVEVGSGVFGKLKKGDRMVVPFTIIYGECDQWTPAFNHFWIRRIMRRSPMLSLHFRTGIRPLPPHSLQGVG